MKTKKSKGASSFSTPSSTPTEGTITEIDFGIEPSKVSGLSKYPLIEGPEAERLADRIRELQIKFDAVADPFKAAKQDLIELGFPQFFEKNKGNMEPPSSMIARGSTGGVRVTFKNKFTPGDKKALEVLLTDQAARWFRQHWVIKIDSDLIPEEQGPALISELKALMARKGLSSALEIKAGILPKADFAQKRHSVFEPETNLKIQKIVPQQAAATAKGVK